MPFPSSLSSLGMLCLLMVPPVLGAPAGGTVPPDPAKVALDVARIKPLLPEGSDLAGAFEATFGSEAPGLQFQLRTGKDYLEAVAGSYLSADLDQDGRPDLAVAVEAAPTRGAEGMACGRRTLLVFLADAAGHLRLAARAPRVLLPADAGGVFGDPFSGMDLGPKGTFRIHHYGGSADRWGTDQTFQFRQGAFRLTGETRTSMNDVTLVGENVDTDLVTGRRITTRMPGAGRKEVVTLTRIRVRPLVKLTDAKVPED